MDHFFISNGSIKNKIQGNIGEVPISYTSGLDSFPKCQFELYGDIVEMM